jgi:nucleoside-diphosphate-sugar epimerase
MRTALVTGGAGFIGSHVVEGLLTHGWQVRVLDSLSSGSRENLESVSRIHRANGYSAVDLQLVEGDVRDAAVCRAACRGVDSVFHLAAIASVAQSVEEPDVTHAVNIGGTLNMLLAARDASARRFVFSSSASVYGNAETSPTDEGQPIHPQSPYATEKACGELYCRNFWELYRLETVILRYFNVFGPRQNVNSGYAAVIPCFIKAIMTDTRPTIYGDGLQTRDFIYAENVAAANLRAALAPGVAGQTFNIGTGHGISLIELLTELERAACATLDPDFQAPRPGEVRHSCADITQATSALGYCPAVTYGEGLRRTLEAVREHAVEAAKTLEPAGRRSGSRVAAHPNCEVVAAG